MPGCGGGPTPRARGPVAAPPTAVRRRPGRGVLLDVPSGRERDVLGTELVISLATGKRHVRHIPARLDLRDRPRAIVLAHECGLVPDRAPR